MVRKSASPADFCTTPPTGNSFFEVRLCNPLFDAFLEKAMESVAVYYYCTTARKHMQETGKTTRRILKRGQLMDKNVGYVLAVRMKPEGIFQSSSDSQRPFALLLIGRYHYPAKIATSFMYSTAHAACIVKCPGHG